MEIIIVCVKSALLILIDVWPNGVDKPRRSVFLIGRKLYETRRAINRRLDFMVRSFFIDDYSVTNNLNMKTVCKRDFFSYANKYFV